MFCAYCRKACNDLTFFTRKTRKGVLMHFCSLECNVAQLEGAVKNFRYRPPDELTKNEAAMLKLYREGLQQLQDWKKKEL